MAHGITKHDRLQVKRGIPVWHNVAEIFDGESIPFEGSAIDFNVTPRQAHYEGSDGILRPAFRIRSKSNGKEQDDCEESPFYSLVTEGKEGQELVLSMVADSYGLMQPKQLWTLFQEFGEFGFNVSTLGTCHARSKIFATLEAPDGTFEPLPGDKFISQISLRTSFDGSWATVGHPSSIRQICFNTASFSLAQMKKGGAFGAIFKIAHKKNSVLGLENAKESIAEFYSQRLAVCEVLQALASAPLSPDTAKPLFLGYFAKQDRAGVWRVSTQAVNTVTEHLEPLFFKGQGNHGKTAYDAFNAVTEHYTHGAPETTAEAQKIFLSSEFGSFAARKTDFVQSLTCNGLESIPERVDQLATIGQSALALWESER